MDATWLWQSEKLSDVRVRLVCTVGVLDPEARPAKRACSRTSRPKAAGASQEQSGMCRAGYILTYLGKPRAPQLLSLFGRVQQVMTSPDVPQSFCSLSLGALRVWAEQDRLPVDSENTVAVLFTHWWEHNKARFTEQQRSEAARCFTEMLRAWDCSRSFVFCVLDQLPWFQPSQQAVHVVRLLHDNADSTPAISQVPAAWAGDQRLIDVEQVKRLSWMVTRAELDQLHQQAAQGNARLMSAPLYWRGFRWQMSLDLPSQDGALSFGVRYSGMLPTSFQHVDPAVLLAGWRLTVESAEGAVTEKFDWPDFKPMEYGVSCGGHYILKVGASAAPRAHSYPPDSLWHSDGKLHLGLTMHTLP